MISEIFYCSNNILVGSCSVFMLSIDVSEQYIVGVKHSPNIGSLLCFGTLCATMWLSVRCRSVKGGN